jgi:hypothetical protein
MTFIPRILSPSAQDNELDLSPKNQIQNSQDQKKNFKNQAVNLKTLSSFLRKQPLIIMSVGHNASFLWEGEIRFSKSDP